MMNWPLRYKMVAWGRIELEGVQHHGQAGLYNTEGFLEGDGNSCQTMRYN